jgi:hypothetical protein
MRWVAGDWRVDLIHLEYASAKPTEYYGGNPGDGEHLRISYCGLFVADVQSVRGLLKHGVPVDQLVEVK